MTIDTSDAYVWHSVEEFPPAYTEIVMTDGDKVIDAYYDCRYTIGGFRVDIEKFNKWRMQLKGGVV